MTDEPAEVQVIDETAVNARRYKALIITGILLPLMLYPYLGQLFLSYNIDYAYRIFYSRILIWITLGLMYLYARNGEAQDFLLWPEKKYDAWFYLKFVVVLYIMVFMSAMVSRIPYWLGLHEDNAVMIKAAVVMQRYPVLLVFSAFTAGVTEEYIFRGYILSRLSLLFKSRHWPVIVSALLFASVHLAYKTLHELLFVFLFGLIVGYHYQKYRNLTVLMIVHFLTDLIAISLYRVHR
jgi:membrane protease YdiL (CAAX protease family)